MKIIRVFPRRTRATPTDDDVRIGVPPGLFDEADEIHVSVTFTWDLPLAEKLAHQWKRVAPVKIGGPATGQRGEEFIPGLYVKQGYTITSRGCPNTCWFCTVWKREGNIRELPIHEGCNVLDDNLLACSESHIRNVFTMLKNQKLGKPEFTGGLEAKLLQPWMANELFKLNPAQLFFAYDTPDDLPHLIKSADLLHQSGFSIKSHKLRCYVLCGYPKDTIKNAQTRMSQVLSIGFTPMAMLYRDHSGKRNPDFIQFQRLWARPAIIHGNLK